MAKLESKLGEEGPGHELIRDLISLRSLMLLLSLFCFLNDFIPFTSADNIAT